MKYIILKMPHGREHPILFPAAFQHSDIATAMVALYPRTQIVAAGTCIMHEVGCGGEATTLNLPSRGIVDAELIEKTL